MRARTSQEQFERYSIPEPNSGCFLWIGALFENGYGMSGLKGRRERRAHRIAYELANGPIPTGKVIDHLCRNRACVNPHHLEAVSLRENLLRGNTITARNAAVTHCPRGHEYRGEHLRIRKDGGRQCRTCRNTERRINNKEE